MYVQEPEDRVASMKTYGNWGQKECFAVEPDDGDKISSYDSTLLYRYVI